ncbi:hypothetical protein ACNI65_13170 [Roseateles sp. So40a]|uniref:hypothetical protein n=1 Tax=Roseateles sp. So40a TaxID=3400226 RepID=UPI003A8799BE
MDFIARKAASTRARQALLSISVTIGVTMMAGSVQAQTPTATTSVDLKGYRFRFESQPAEVLARPPELAPRSTVTIIRLRADGDEPVYLQTLPLEPGCGKLPAVSVLADRYVMLCGHFGGRHYTHQVFRIGALGPEATTLDAFDDPARLTVGADGAVIARISRRDVVPGRVGSAYVPIDYLLQADESSFGFVPLASAKDDPRQTRAPR